jgi:hypothetical protein
MQESIVKCKQEPSGLFHRRPLGDCVEGKRLRLLRYLHHRRVPLTAVDRNVFRVRRMRLEQRVVALLSAPQERHTVSAPYEEPRNTETDEDSSNDRADDDPSDGPAAELVTRRGVFNNRERKRGCRVQALQERRVQRRG